MSLRTTPVSQCLDKKLLILGYEIPDILAILIALSILNFVFGSTNMKLALVWAPTIALAVVLRLGKKGKPDNYLVHWVRFKLRPRILNAFSDDPNFATPPRILKKGKK